MAGYFGSGGGRGRGGNFGGGGRGGRGRGGGGGGGSQPRLKQCRDFASTGACPRGQNCQYAHVVKSLGCMVVSDRNPDARRNAHHKGYGSQSNQKTKEYHKASSVAVWETGGGIKLFTGSHDGKWRLFNTAPTTHRGGASGAVALTKEFEHPVGGPIDAVHVASHYFFCGFEASPGEIAPDARAGMVHSWNLNAAADPPMELWMGSHSKYAGSGRIRSLWTTSDGRVWSGGTDGVIREWAFNPAGGPGGKGGFSHVRSMGGHLGAVTGLALVEKNGWLWSGGMDGTLRVWDTKAGSETHIIPAGKKGGHGQNNTNGEQQQLGHTGPVTGLLPFDLPGDGGTFVISASLDETVKAWNAANGERVASESHGQGVTAIALSADLKGNPLLLCGLFYGDIVIRGTVTNPPLVSLVKLSHNFLGVGHELGPVNDIQSGPGNTFYSVADDGKLVVWQIVGDFGL